METALNCRPTQKAYTLAVQQEQSGNIVVNIVADTYFGAR